MRLILTISILLHSPLTVAFCPFQSKRLEGVLEKAKALKASVQESLNCQKKIDLSQHISTLSKSAIQIHKLVSQKINKDLTPELSNQSPDELPIEKILGSFQKIGSIISDDSLSAACPRVYHSQDFWVSLVKMFNEVSPYITSLSPSISQFNLGIKAIGEITNHILKKSLQDKLAFDMSTLKKREAFINTSCLLHQLASTTYHIDSSLNSQNHYLLELKAELKKKSALNSKVIFENENFLEMMASEVQQIERNLLPLIKSHRSPDNLSQISPIHSRSTQPNQGSSEYACTLTKKYLNNQELGIKRIDRLKFYVLFLARHENFQGNEIDALKLSMDIEELDKLEASFKEENYCNLSSIREVVTHLQDRLQSFNTTLKKFSIKDYMNFKSSLDSQANTDLQVNLINKQMELYQSLHEENIYIDLSEIYLIEKSITDLLLSRKNYAFSWVLFNANKGEEYLDDFEAKVSRIKYSNSQNPRACHLLSQIKRDYQVAKTLLNRSLFYCKQMSFISSETKHSNFIKICDSTLHPPKMRPTPYAPRQFQAYPQTARLSKRLNNLRTKVDKVNETYTEKNCLLESAEKIDSVIEF